MNSFEVAADTTLYTVLSSDTTLTALLSGGTASPSIFRALAPEGTDPPYVVFQSQSPSVPVRVMSGVAFENALYTVRAVVESKSAASAGTIAARVDTLLDGPVLSFGANYTHVGVYRVQSVDYTEQVPGGQLLQHRGATYRLMADPS